MLLLDESSVLRSVATIATAIEWLGYTLLAALTYFGLRFLWRPVRHPNGSLHWSRNFPRWLTALLFLAPIGWVLYGWLWPKWSIAREEKAYHAQQLRLVGDYQLDTEASDSCTRSYSFTLSLQADGSFRAQTNLVEWNSLTRGRWRLNADGYPSLIVLLEPSQGKIKTYPLYTSDTTLYLRAAMGVQADRAMCEFRLSKRRSSAR